MPDPTPESLLVRDCMTTDLVTVAPTDDVFDAVEKLLKYRVSGAPVVLEGNVLQGIITEKDCLTLLATGFESMLPKAAVETFMNRDVETLSPETTLFEVASRFLSGSYRRFPVVEGDVLVGLISRRDVLQAIQNAHGHGRSVFKRY